MARGSRGLLAKAPATRRERRGETPVTPVTPERDRWDITSDTLARSERLVPWGEAGGGVDGLEAGEDDETVEELIVDLRREEASVVGVVALLFAVLWKLTRDDGRDGVPAMAGSMADEAQSGTALRWRLGGWVCCCGIDEE